MLRRDFEVQGRRPGAGAGWRSTGDGWRKGQEETHHRPQAEESVEMLGRRRAGASNIVTRDRRESCEEAAVLKIIQVVDSQSGEVVITVPTVGFNDARTRVPSCGTWEARDGIATMECKHYTSKYRKMATEILHENNGYGIWL